MTTELRTGAGRDLLLSFAGPWNDVPRDIIESYLPRIEAEAARRALEDAAERVRALPKFALVDAPGLDFVLAEDVLSLLSTKEEGS